MSSPNSHQTQIILPQPWHLADSLGVVRVRHCLYARIGTSQDGPNGWGYLPGQWRLASVAYPSSWSRAELTMGHSVAVTNAGLLRS